jgi:RNA polymerase sigma factor (sigma-70 family)
MPAWPTVLGVEDRGVVAAIVDGDPRGLAAAYDKYADRLHAFCASMLRDPDAAADALHDTFIVASQRVRQLRDPDRFRPWLYAVARNECLRQLRTRRRTAGLDAAGEVTDTSVDLDGNLRAAELRRLIWAAAEGLNPRERAALELSLRHGLEGLDLADALGVTTSHMNTLLTRARQQLERSLAALIVVRTGRGACPELTRLAAGWDGHLTVLMRKRISRHIESCDACSARKRDEVSATALLATLPVVAAPFGLRRKVLNDAGDIQLVAERKRIARQAGHFNRAGFPASYQHLRHPVDSRQWSAAAVIVGIVLLGGLLTWQTQLGGADRSASGATVPGATDPSGTAPGNGPSGGQQGNGTGGAGPGGGAANPAGPGGGLGPGGVPGPGGAPGTSTFPGGPDSQIPGSPSGPGGPSGGGGTPTDAPSGGTPSPSPTKPTRGDPTETPEPGILTVNPDSVSLGTSLTSTKVKVKGKGGSVSSWTASVTSGSSVLSLNKSSGGPVAPGAGENVKIKLDRAAAAAAGITSGEVVFQSPSGVVAVEVIWQNASPTAG